MLIALSQTSLYFSNDSLFLISKDMHLVSLKLLIQPSISGSLITFLSCLCLMKNFASVFQIFVICRRIRCYYFIDVYNIYASWIFIRMKFHCCCTSKIALLFIERKKYFYQNKNRAPCRKKTYVLKGLKQSSLIRKCVFYRKEHISKGDPHRTEF